MIINLSGPAVKFSKTPASIRRAPPKHGEHTAEVLQEVGISPDEIKKLQEQGVI